MRAGGGWAAGLLAWVAQPSRADLCVLMQVWLMGFCLTGASLIETG